MNILDDDLTRLNIDDFLFIILIIARFFNICGDQYQKSYIKNNANYLKSKASNFYLISLLITIVVYFYFTYKNYHMYKKCEEKDKYLFEIKLIGSVTLIVGALYLVYFQMNDPNFIDPPEI